MPLVLAAFLVVQVPDTTGRDTVPTVLPPVTVTATRRSTNVFQVPLALTQLKKRDLFGTTGYGLDDALSLVPGVVVQSRYGNQDVRIAIRGYGARGAGDRSNAGTARGIRVLLDGFPETEPDGRTSFDGIDLAAAQSIEVIRSNASAVWGNAAGGVVSVSTLPAFDDRLGALEPTVGSFGLRRWALRGGVRLGAGKLAASFVRSEFDGWRGHSASERSLLNAALVTTGGNGRTVACGICHGADLRGIGPVPHIAGRSPSYLVRQMYDMQVGARRGEWSSLMKPVVDKLTDEDYVSIAAYVSSRTP